MQRNTHRPHPVPCECWEPHLPCLQLFYQSTIKSCPMNEHEWSAVIMWTDVWKRECNHILGLWCVCHKIVMWSPGYNYSCKRLLYFLCESFFFTGCAWVWCHTVVLLSLLGKNRFGVKQWRDFCAATGKVFELAGVTRWNKRSFLLG